MGWRPVRRCRTSVRARRDTLIHATRLDVEDRALAWLFPAGPSGRPAAIVQRSVSQWRPMWWTAVWVACESMTGCRPLETKRRAPRVLGPLFCPTRRRAVGWRWLPSCEASVARPRRATAGRLRAVQGDLE